MDRSSIPSPRSWWKFYLEVLFGSFISTLTVFCRSNESRRKAKLSAASSWLISSIFTLYFLICSFMSISTHLWERQGVIELPHTMKVLKQPWWGGMLLLAWGCLSHTRGWSVTTVSQPIPHSSTAWKQGEESNTAGTAGQVMVTGNGTCSSWDHHSLPCWLYTVVSTQTLPQLPTAPAASTCCPCAGTGWQRHNEPATALLQLYGPRGQ